MAHDDFEVEPVKGLPEQLPHGERILWQGAPRPVPLARQSMWLSWVGGYFLILAAWSGIDVALVEGAAPGLAAASLYLTMGVAACALILGAAWLFARTTVYTITTERVAMRIGAALTVTLNLPFRWIQRADLALHRDGTGSIHLDLKGDTRIGYLVCWPHVRPWVMSRTQPTLRAIPDARRVAEILGGAVGARVGGVSVEVEEEPDGPVPVAAE